MIEEIKALTADATNELNALGTDIAVPAISVGIFNDISPKTSPALRKLVSLSNVYIPALIAEMERMTDISRQNYCKFMRKQEDNFAKDQQIAMLKKALEQACQWLANSDSCKFSGSIRTCAPKSQKEYMNELMQQAQQLTHETHGESEADNAEKA
jgi:site-specific recombinase XerC